MNIKYKETVIQEGSLIDLLDVKDWMKQRKSNMLESVGVITKVGKEGAQKYILRIYFDDDCNTISLSPWNSHESFVEFKTNSSLSNESIVELIEQTISKIEPEIE